MNGLDALILGSVQGIAEFLPISSSGHLVLLENYLGLDFESLKSFDVAVHMGTLLAILIYFWKDIWEMVKAIGRLCIGRLQSTDFYGKMILFIIIGTIPAVLLGLFAGDAIDEYFRNPRQVAINIFVVALVFLIGEWVYKKYYNNNFKAITWPKALIIGIAQSIALVPGVSRSGASIVAGLFQGVRRDEAARFSFLLGIPAILGAGLFTFVNVRNGDSAPVEMLNLIIGFSSSFVFGIASIALLMKFLKKHTLAVFAVYRILLAGVLLI